MASSRADKSRNVVKRIFNALKKASQPGPYPHQFTTILTIPFPPDLQKHFILSAAADIFLEL